MTVQNKKENMVFPSAPWLPVHSVICRDLESLIQSLHMQHTETLLHHYHHLNIEMPNGHLLHVPVRNAFHSVWLDSFSFHLIAWQIGNWRCGKKRSDVYVPLACSQSFSFKMCCFPSFDSLQ